MAMNDPRREYYKTYEVEYDRHTYDGHNWKYVNLPMTDIARMAIASLKDSAKMYSSYDVGKQFDRKRGYLDSDNYDYATLFGTTFPMDKADRIRTLRQWFYPRYDAHRRRPRRQRQSYEVEASKTLGARPMVSAAVLS